MAMTKAELADIKGFNKKFITYAVVGGNTYAIKDELRAAGCSFSRELGWHSPKKIEVPEGFSLLELTFDECYFMIGSYPEPNIEVSARIRELNVVKEEIPEEYRNSEFFGEIGERIRNLTAKLVSSRSVPTSYGGSFCHTFLSGGNVFVWWTTSRSLSEFEEGSTIMLSGTVKKLTEYRGVKQTVLSRCLIKPLS